MSNLPSRYTAPAAVCVSEGWTLDRLTPPSRLFGANGIRAGRDGRIYVAQVAGSQVSAVDPRSGAVEAISPRGAGIVSPDDLAIDEDGTIYCTEITEGRVSARLPDGRIEVLARGMIAPNPVALHQGRIIAGECNVDGRIVEIDRNGGAPRIIASGVPMPNAFQVGADGKLYFPVMGTNEIWRVDLDGGEPEVVAGGLSRPDSVRFDPQGHLVSTQFTSGEVVRIDPRNGAKQVLAQLPPGLDNCTFMGDRLFVSHIDGSLFELGGGGKARTVLPQGLLAPLGLAVGTDGSLLVADGFMSYLIDPGSREMTLAGLTSTHGYPGYLRAIAASGPGEWIAATANGDVSRWRPAEGRLDVLSTGHDRLMGVAIAPGGAPVVAEFGTGRVLVIESGQARELVRGLDQPMGVAIAADGSVFVAESGAGRVARIKAGIAETVIDGLSRPEGLTIAGGRLFVLDIQHKALVSTDLAGGDRQTVATDLPVGSPPGVAPEFLGGIGTMVGPQMRFAGLASSPDGTIFIAADAEGSVLAARPDRR